MVKRSICILLACVLTGCAAGDANEPTAASPQPAMPGPVGTGPLVAGQAAPVAPAADAAPQASAALPTIPAGARFSIFCDSYDGPDHVQFATNVKGLLVKNTKLRDWYVIHQSGQSSLYHGYYTEVSATAGGDRDARRDADRAQRDRAMVESIPSPTDPMQKMFARSLFVPLDAPDPDAPPAWNLTNAPGFWTVQVAAFTGADRKRQTVEAVRQARAQQVPAFYYHGPAVSSVCVGSWDRSAIKEQGVSRPGNVDQDPHARDEGDFIVNYTDQDVSKAVGKRVGRDGEAPQVYQSKMEVLDATLMSTLKQYPAQAVDGFDVPLKGTDPSGKVVTRPRPSMVVRIPRDDRSLANAPRDDGPDPTLLRPPAGGQNLNNRLRGIGQ